MQGAAPIGSNLSAADVTPGARETRDASAFGQAMAQADRSEPPSMGPRLTRSLFDPQVDAMLHLDEQAAAAWMHRPAPRAAQVAPPASPPVTDAALADAPAPAPQTDAASADLAVNPAEGVDASAHPSRPSPFEGLHLGQRDTAPDGPITRMQRVLERWNPRLELSANGHYDTRTERAVLLYKTIYGTGADGRRIDRQTASHVAGMEDGSFWRNPPPKSAAGRLLYAASQHLGTPYQLGGDGAGSTDCGMLTRQALVGAGLADGSFSRLADAQYRYAETGQEGLHLTSSPKPGDLVFFHHPTRQSPEAYRGITHVGIYLSDDCMLAASSRHGKVVLQRMGGLAPYVSGYGRPTEPSTALLGRR